MTLYLGDETRVLSHGTDLKCCIDSDGGECVSRKVSMKSAVLICELSSVSSFMVAVVRCQAVSSSVCKALNELVVTCQLVPIDWAGLSVCSDPSRSFPTFWGITAMLREVVHNPATAQLERTSARKISGLPIRLARQARSLGGHHGNRQGWHSWTSSNNVAGTSHMLDSSSRRPPLSGCCSQ